jgi:hypothetical protein
MELIGNFHPIEYAEIDLVKTEVLLKEQGLLLIDLGWFRARTLIGLINEEKKLNSYRALRIGRLRGIFIVLYDIFRLVPLALFSSKLVELHCIYVNHCSEAEWKKLETGKFRFTLL